MSSSPDLNLRIDRAARTPLATQLAHQLAWLIASGELNEGDELPAIRELGDELGINLHTVRAAYAQLAQDNLVRTERGRRTRVLPFDRSRGRAVGGDVPSFTIGLIIPEFSPFYGPMLQGIEEAARDRHSLVFVCTAHESDTLAGHYLDRLVARQVDGIILAAQLPPGTPLPPVSLTPVVSIDVPGTPGPGVEFDLEGSQYLATRHLVEHGHTRIGLVAAPLHLSNVEPKLRGHLRALEGAGIAQDPALIVEAQDFGPGAGAAAADQLLDLADPPTAIATSSDGLAFGVFRATVERGLTVPDDIALVGNDGVEMASVLEPGLTTVVLPVAEAGRAAVEMLGQSNSGIEPVRAVLDVELVVRTSCGCAPGSD